MKIAVICDSHFGVRNDNETFYPYFDKFYSDIFFPTIDKKKVEYVFHLGDLYDRRRYINFKTANEAEKIFLNPLQKRIGKSLKEVIILSGNHDIYYRDINTINSLDILLSRYDFTIYHDPIERKFDTCHILFLPWICETNKNKTFELIDKTKASIAMGHLELSGYKMYQDSVPSEHGLDSNLFKKFKSVYSGHFHHKSTKDNITYLGAACEYTWSDYNDPRGFHIFDTKTKEMEFIQNPYSIFSIVHYKDDIEIPDIENKYVKILVEKKEDIYKFDTFIKNIQKQKTIDVTVIEENILINDDENEIDEEIKSTITLIDESIESMNTSLSKKKLKEKMFNIYNEAVALGC